jgi:hypothetical protein
MGVFRLEVSTGRVGLVARGRRLVLDARQGGVVLLPQGAKQGAVAIPRLNDPIIFVRRHDIPLGVAAKAFHFE